MKYLRRKEFPVVKFRPARHFLEKKFMNWENHVAIVTGASRGIGGEIAAVLARKGAAVCVHYHRAQEEAEKVVKLIRKEGGSAAALQADVRNYEQVGNLVAQCQEIFGPADILVNNARQIEQKKKFLDLAWSDFLAQMDVILQGAVHCCQAVIPSMKEKRNGRIVNILSTTI
ncbi:MAG: SDR family NAD(P)-dependent oxidoreductase, partial [Waddliaceae bacterium]